MTTLIETEHRMIENNLRWTKNGSLWNFGRKTISNVDKKETMKFNRKWNTSACMRVEQWLFNNGNSFNREKNFFLYLTTESNVEHWQCSVIRCRNAFYVIYILSFSVNTTTLSMNEWMNEWTFKTFLGFFLLQIRMFRCEWIRFWSNTISSNDNNNSNKMRRSEKTRLKRTQSNRKLTNAVRHFLHCSMFPWNEKDWQRSQFNILCVEYVKCAIKMFRTKRSHSKL